MTDFTIPTKKQLCDALGQQRLTDNVYTDLTSLLRVINDYDKPIAFEYLNYRAYHDYQYSIDPESNNAKDRHKSRLDKLGKWDSDTVHHVVGRIPESSVWLNTVLKNISEDSITSENMNRVQQECVRLGDERKEIYHQASGWEIQERVLDDIDISELDANTVGDIIDSIIKDVIDISVDNLPSRTNASNQGGKSSAGSANEDISKRVLSNVGLKQEKDAKNNSNFNFTTHTDDADIIVYSNFDYKMYIEVKSTSIKERVGRSFGEGEYWTLIGYFDDSEKIRSEIIEGNKQGESWYKQARTVYVPPKRIMEIESLDKSSNDSYNIHSLTKNGVLFLRSNTEFANDMKHFVEKGELPNKKSGHEKQYI